MARKKKTPKRRFVRRDEAAKHEAHLIVRPAWWSDAVHCEEMMDNGWPPLSECVMDHLKPFQPVDSKWQHAVRLVAKD